jgi:ribose transport system permease protein
VTLLAEPEAPRKPPAPRRGGWARGALTGQRAGLVVVIVALVVVFGTLRPTFYDSRLVVFPMLRDIATLAVVGLAQLAALSIGHLNLAVGRMAAFGAMAAGFGYQVLGLPLVAGLALGLVAGAAVGATAGLIITSTGVNSFVVTLGMDFVLLGLVTLVYGQFTSLGAFTVKPPGMDALRQYSLADVCVGDVCGSPAVPQLLAFTAVAMLGVGYLYSRARAGREMLLTGSNVVAAELSGIPTTRRTVGAHALSGLLASLAGFMLAVTAGSFTAGIGAQFLIPSFLGPVLGGTALAGGAVSVVGTFLGISLTQTIQQGLTMLGIGVESLQIYLGAILLVALSADRIRQLFARRRSS